MDEGREGDGCGKCVLCSVVVNRGQQTTTTNLEEIVWSSSGDVWFTATRGGIELEAGRTERCFVSLTSTVDRMALTMKTSMNRLIPLMLLDFRIDNSSLALRKL